MRIPDSPRPAVRDLHIGMRAGNPGAVEFQRADSIRDDELHAQQLLVLIRLHDEGGLRRLHAMFSQRVHRCAIGIVRRDDLAHEVVSTSFMQVWTNAADYDPDRGGVIAWLMLIARSRSLDALRRVRLLRSQEVSVEEDDSLAELGSDPAMEPLSVLESLNRRCRLKRALSRLTPIQRQIVSLTSLDGFSHDEASRRLDMPLGTVKSHARRGLAALKQRCAASGLTVD